MKKKIIIPVLTILGIALILVGTSYAYWRFTYISDKTNIGKSKCLSIELTNQKNEISLNNTYPISDIEGKKLTPYSFTINNTCDTFISYDVNLEMLEGTTMNSKYMAVMVNNEHKELLSNLDSANTVMNSSVESRKLVSGSLGVGDSVDYTLRLWMDESVTLSDDAMNKNFTSKIVVTAQPSNYSPKEAGYDTLHDAILANEYQTTPEKAIEKIKAKGEPDLSKTAPIITYNESESSNTLATVIKPSSDSINGVNQLSNLNINETLMHICTEKKFNSETGNFNLSGCDLLDPTELDLSKNYYFIREYLEYNSISRKYQVVYETSEFTVYKINAATKSIENYNEHEITFETIKYKLSVTPIKGTINELDKSDTGLYQTADIYGTSYYYRGNVKNNNIFFGGFYWQIIRINGDGSIRVMYNGSEQASNDVERTIGNYQFNKNSNNPAYVGYMYGNKTDSLENNLKNEVDSTIKTVVDNWYNKFFSNTIYANYIFDSGFCNDRSIYWGDGFSTDASTYYISHSRALNSQASLLCNNKNDFFTVENNTGNKALTYPIGLITYDELMYAGINYQKANKYSYVSSTILYWTMSPSQFYKDNGLAIGTLNYGERIMFNSVDYGRYVKPVINLKPDVKISGGIGTSNDPFVVDTNN